MQTGHLIKLSFRPYTLEQACRAVYYLNVCAIDAIMGAADDLCLPLERILYNRTPLTPYVPLDHSQHTVFEEVNEIRLAVERPIYDIVGGAASSSLTSLGILNVSCFIHQYNHIVLSHEVFQQ